MIRLLNIVNIIDMLLYIVNVMIRGLLILCILRGWFVGFRIVGRCKCGGSG